MVSRPGNATIDQAARENDHVSSPRRAHAELASRIAGIVIAVAIIGVAVCRLWVIATHGHTSNTEIAEEQGGIQSRDQTQTIGRTELTDWSPLYPPVEAAESQGSGALCSKMSTESWLLTVDSRTMVLRTSEGLNAFDLKTGERLWRFRVRGASVLSAGSDGILFSQGLTTYLVGTESGDIEWSGYVGTAEEIPFDGRSVIEASAGLQRRQDVDLPGLTGTAADHLDASMVLRQSSHPFGAIGFHFELTGYGSTTGQESWLFDARCTSNSWLLSIGGGRSYGSVHTMAGQSSAPDLAVSIGPWLPTVGSGLLELTTLDLLTGQLVSHIRSSGELNSFLDSMDITYVVTDDGNVRQYAAINADRGLLTDGSPGDVAAAQLPNVLVSTTPSGAEIYLDGIRLGKSPHQIRRLIPGIHEVTAELAGYGTEQVRFVLENGANESIHFGLKNRQEIMWMADTPRIQPTSIFADGDIVVAVGEGGVVALDSASGHRLWSDFSEAGGPTAVSLGLVVRSADRRMTAMSTDTGVVQWSLDLREYVRQVTFGGAAVLAGDSDGGFYLIHPRSGMVIWEKKKKHGYSSTLVHEDTLFLSSPNGGCTGIDATTGRSIWRKRIGGNCVSLVATGKAREPKVLHYDASTGDLKIIDGSTGVTEYIESGVSEPMSAGRGTIVYYKLWRVGDKTGIMFRRLATSFQPTSAAFVDVDTARPEDLTISVRGGSAFIADKNRLVAANLENGKIEWTRRLAGAEALYHLPNDVVLILADGEIHFVDEKTGGTVWRMDMVSKINSVVIQNNHVYLLSVHTIYGIVSDAVDNSPPIMRDKNGSYHPVSATNTASL
jgi:outer membrane protein assembly factor BamB